MRLRYHTPAWRVFRLIGQECGGSAGSCHRKARDAFLSLLKTARKHDIVPVDYVQKRLGITGTPDVPWLPDLVLQT